MGSPPNLNNPFLTSDGTLGACRLLWATSTKQDILHISGSCKRLRLAVTHFEIPCYVQYAYSPQRQQRLRSGDDQRDGQNDESQTSENSLSR